MLGVEYVGDFVPTGQDFGDSAEGEDRTKRGSDDFGLALGDGGEQVPDVVDLMPNSALDPLCRQADYAE